MLRVTRKQFPLAPGFATTAHAAQGQTCPEGVLMDMHIGDAGDPLAVYIALTRVKNRYGLFVYRPFAAAPFQKGAKKGRELLLRFWGGEHMDWAFLRAKYRDEKLCSECKEQKPVGAFTPGRWKRTDESMHAETCGRIATMAMHGLQSLEGRKFVCRDPQAPTVYVLPCLSDVRGRKVLRRLRQSETERQVFHSNVAEEACRRAVLFVLCDESLWLVDMQWLRFGKKTEGI